MRLVDDQQPARAEQVRQPAGEAGVGQPLRARSAARRARPRRSVGQHRLPVVDVGRVDRGRPQPGPLGRGDLVAHQGQQRRDDQRRARRRARAARRSPPSRPPTCPSRWPARPAPAAGGRPARPPPAPGPRGGRVRAGHRGDGPAEGVLAGEGEGAVDCHARHTARWHRQPGRRRCIARPLRDGRADGLDRDAAARSTPSASCCPPIAPRDLRRPDADRRRPVRGRGPRGRAGRSDADHRHDGRSAGATDVREIATSAFSRASWALDDPTVRLLAPIDLQVIKAAGVTFAVSMVERVIEERAAGDPHRAQEVRAPGPVRHRRLDRRHPAGQRQGHRGQGGPAGRGSVVAVSRGGHRTRPGDLHQGAGAVRRRPRCPHRRAGPLGLEQPRARGGAGRRPGRASRRRRRWATTSTCATSRAAVRCCSARPRTTTRPVRSDR